MQLKRRFLSSFPVTYKQFCKYTRQGTVAVSWLMFWYDMSSHFFPRVGRRKPAKKEIDFLWRPFSRPRGCSLLFVMYCPLFVQSPALTFLPHPYIKTIVRTLTAMENCKREKEIAQRLLWTLMTSVTVGTASSLTHAMQASQAECESALFNGCNWISGESGRGSLSLALLGADTSNYGNQS